MFRTLAVAATAAATLLFGAAAEASTSGTIQLKGSVAKTCTISVSDVNATLDIVGGENSRSVGTVVENCNSGSGYDITITSANSGALRAGNATVNYSVVYDNQTQTLGSPWTVNRNSAQFGKQVTVGVTIPARPNAVAGSYTDTLTIQIAAK